MQSASSIPAICYYVHQCSLCGHHLPITSFSRFTSYTRVGNYAAKCKGCIFQGIKKKKQIDDSTPKQKLMRQIIAFIAGYQRKCNIKIPMEIINLFFYFIGGKDEWDINFGCPKGIKLMDDNQTIIHQARNGHFCSVYLRNIIKTGKHCWIFQIKQIKQIEWSIIIGIWNINTSKHLYTDNYPLSCLNSGYGYFVYDKAMNNPNKVYDICIKSKNISLKNDGKDIVSMIVDLNKHKVNWKLNDVDLFKNYAYNKVFGCEYRAFVTLTQNENTVTLISYQQL